VDPDIAWKRVGENNKQLISWHWPGGDVSILPIVISVVDTTILSIVNPGNTGLADLSLKIGEIWGCLEEPNGDGGLYACNITPIVDKNTAAGWVKGAMKLTNLTLCCIHYRGQKANSINGAQTSIHCGSSYLPADYILPPPAEDMIDDIREQSDDDRKM
jgi:hypothetical protein